jgi:putative membrane-bound dehydrogenase-like protein
MRSPFWKSACIAALAGIAPAMTSLSAPVTLDGRTFEVADGFTLERVAGSDLAPRPVSASFDDQGRLYVTDSSGSNLPPAEQLKNPTHRILRLEDTDKDGRFDKVVVFADKVMFPQGCLWHDGWVYVAAPPSIWRFRDADGDGVAELRYEWFKGGTLTGCANDIHGPYLGPDGRIYWTKGAFAEQNHPRPGRTPIHDRAAHILRAKPDGSDLDVVMTGGMDNPVEVAFTPDGEPVFTSTFIDFTQPGRRDGIAHALYGGVFGKVNAVLDDRAVIRTGPDLLHPFVQFGAGAPSGLCRYQSSVFGPAFKDNLFASTFNLHKITRHALRNDGATYASTDSDFVSTEDVDFHPTDVLEDADGSLLIVDTGGWYKLCCPTAQLAKPDVLGGIYRVRKAGHKHSADSAARRRLVAPPSATTPQWKLHHAAIERDAKRLSEFRNPVVQYVDKNTPGDGTVRVAAEGLGRLGDKASVNLLLSAAAKTTEPHLEHAFLYALVEIADPAPLRTALLAGLPARRRAALIALDQLPGDQLSPNDVLPFLTDGNRRLWDAAQWVISRHPEWSAQLVGWFKLQLDDPQSRGSVASQLKFLQPSDAGRDLLATVARQSRYGATARRSALQAMADANPKEAPASWTDSLVDALKDADSDLVRTAIAASKPLASNPAIEPVLRRIARSSAHPVEVRVAAFGMLPASWIPAAGDLAALVETGPTRDAAAAIARARLSAEDRLGLTAQLRSAPPMELLALLSAFEPAGDESLGKAVLDALRNAKSRASLRPELVRNLFKKYPDSTRSAAEAFTRELDADLAQQAARLESLLGELKALSGDVRRGQAVFLGQKAACYNCHKIGYRGGLVGPDLTRIGEARSERDLLESIVYPSSSFVRSYEPVVVTLRDGTDVSGILRSETDRELVVVSGPEAEQKIARSDVASLRPGTVSLMPAGLDTQVSKQELADLLAFLKNTKWGAN